MTSIDNKLLQAIVYKRRCSMHISIQANLAWFLMVKRESIGAFAQTRTLGIQLTSSIC
jgi:hypothetical protein